MAKFEMYKSPNGQFYYHLKASGNYRTILSGEGYTTKANCENGINSVKENAPDDSRYERLAARNGQYYFNLKAANGAIIGTSETYINRSNMEDGIEVVKAQAPSASIVDLTSI